MSSEKDFSHIIMHNYITYKVSPARTEGRKLKISTEHSDKNNNYIIVHNGIHFCFVPFDIMEPFNKNYPYCIDSNYEYDGKKIFVTQATIDLWVAIIANRFISELKVDSNFKISLIIEGAVYRCIDDDSSVPVPSLAPKLFKTSICETIIDKFDFVKEEKMSFITIVSSDCSDSYEYDDKKACSSKPLECKNNSDEDHIVSAIQELCFVKKNSVYKHSKDSLMKICSNSKNREMLILFRDLDKWISDNDNIENENLITIRNSLVYTIRVWVIIHIYMDRVYPAFRSVKDVEKKFDEISKDLYANINKLNSIYTNSIETGKSIPKDSLLSERNAFSRYYNALYNNYYNKNSIETLVYSTL